MKEYWKALGLHVTAKFRENALYSQRHRSPDHGIPVNPLYFSTETFAEYRCVLGGVSGYYGGAADMLIQRLTVWGM